MPTDDEALRARARQTISNAIRAGLNDSPLPDEKRRQELEAAFRKMPSADLYDFQVDWTRNLAGDSPYGSPLIKAGRVDTSKPVPRYVHFKLQKVVVFFCEIAIGLAASSGLAAGVFLALATAQVHDSFGKLYRNFQGNHGQVLYEMYVLTNNGSRGLEVDKAVLLSAVNARLEEEGRQQIGETEFSEIVDAVLDMDVLSRVGTKLQWNDVAVLKN